MTTRRLVCVALLLAAFTPGAAAEKQRPARPAGKDVQLEVPRGGSVRIPLRGFERNLNRLVYRVLENPRHGRLSGLEQYDGPDRQGAGSITYTHGDDEESTEDEFIFEVRAPSTKLAGRGRVRIRIVDSPAKLQITPSTLDFGEVAVGDPPARRIVELANVGGGVLQGLLEVPAPFALGGDGNFVLRRGRSTRIPVLFAPERAGPYSFPLQPALGDPATLILRGEALSPFFVETESTNFSTNEGSRSLTVKVINKSQTSRNITVSFPAGSPVEPVARLALEPGETKDTVLRLPAEHKTGIPEFGVRFKDQDHEQMLTLAAPALPAKLVIVREPDFGVILPRRVPQATLVLRNDGGSAAEGRLQQSDILSSADGTPAFRIEPGEEYAMELELRLRKDSAPPTEGHLVFRGTDFPFGIEATIAPTAEEKTTATTTDNDTTEDEDTREPPPEWALNSDIQCITTQEGLAIRWTEKNGWIKVIVQHRTDAAAPWQDYQLPTPREGLLGRLQSLLGWFQSLGGQIQGFLDTPIDRNTVEELSGEQEKFGQTRIAADAPAGNDLWRLQATSSSSGETRTVSRAFRIEKDRKLVAVTGQPEPAPAPAAATVARPRKLGPVTPIVSAGIKAERRGATLQIAFARELGIRGFRLERGAMVSSVDPKTGIPAAPEFEPLAKPDAGVETIFFGEGEAEGRKLTVCAARIDGLPVGTRTYWRVVPAGPDGDLPPTTVLLVDTLPNPPIPWSKILLGILFLLLAGVLYLRWKINRPPG